MKVKGCRYLLEVFIGGIYWRCLLEVLIGGVYSVTGLVFVRPLVQCVEFSAQFVQLVVDVVDFSTQLFVRAQIRIELPLIVLSLRAGHDLWVQTREHTHTHSANAFTLTLICIMYVAVHCGK